MGWPLTIAVTVGAVVLVFVGIPLFNSLNLRAADRRLAARQAKSAEGGQR